MTKPTCVKSQCIIPFTTQVNAHYQTQMSLTHEIRCRQHIEPFTRHKQQADGNILDTN